MNQFLTTEEREIKAILNSFPLCLCGSNDSWQEFICPLIQSHLYFFFHIVSCKGKIMSKDKKMKLLLSRPRGFCAGVERAIETVEKALILWGAPIYVKHEIVHNRHVVQGLKDKGAIFIENIEDVPVGARLIYSAHGVSPAVREQARARQLIEIDATCGLVTRVHSAVKRFANLKYQIILIGHRNHVEIIGTAG